MSKARTFRVLLVPKRILRQAQDKVWESEDALNKKGGDEITRLHLFYYKMANGQGTEV